MGKINLIGKRVGRLVVIAEANSRIMGKNKRKLMAYWLCKCDCGVIKEIKAESLLRNHTRSCGCYYAEAKKHYIHGGANTKEFYAWQAILNRCYNKNNNRYYTYGEREITVCESWKNSFSNFIKDMGLCPPHKKSLGRIDNNKGYYPENCRWEDDFEQANNKKSNVIIEYKGERMTMGQWSRRLNCKYGKLRHLYRTKKIPFNEIIENNLHK